MKTLIIISLILFSILVIWGLCAQADNSKNISEYSVRIVALSEELLWNVKTGLPTDSLESVLEEIEFQELVSGLGNDNARKTFWINTYNAWFQILSIRDNKTKPGIFTDKLINIAGIEFSLDDIEHGILRKFRWKYSLGYLPQFCPPDFIKQLSVSKLDYRIHFALNCGAKSCPPIAFYRYDKIEEQLESATLSYLNSETDIDESNKTVRVSKIFQWFIGDFGGKKGINKILSKFFKKDFSDFRIIFNDYDNTVELKNFINDNHSETRDMIPEK